MDQAIDWYSKESHVLANPRLPPVLLPSDWEGYSSLKGHVWVATSGTTSSAQQMKWIALSKKAILHSAEAVNQYLESSSRDIWLNPLPLFHVGGLAIHARAFLSGAKFLSMPSWKVEDFYQLIFEKNITLTSLVPAQLFDLVSRQLTPPPSLRAVLIGGGRLHLHLYQQGRELGWPLLPTFGMTECSSQIATAKLSDPTLKILPHVECKVDQGRLAVRSPSLFTGQLEIKGSAFHWFDPKRDGWYLTEDLVELSQGTLRSFGRLQDWVKIGGENVSLIRLEELFDQLKGELDAQLLATPHPRLGHQIEVATLPQYQDKIDLAVEQFNALVMPYERIRELHIVPFIPRSSLGKVLKQQVLPNC